MLPKCRYFLVTRILLALILTAVGFSKTYLIKDGYFIYDKIWFPLGVIVKRVTGNEFLMLLAALFQFLLIFESVNKFEKRPIIFTLIVVITYSSLVGISFAIA